MKPTDTYQADVTVTDDRPLTGTTPDNIHEQMWAELKEKFTGARDKVAPNTVRWDAMDNALLFMRWIEDKYGFPR